MYMYLYLICITVSINDIIIFDLIQTYTTLNLVSRDSLSLVTSQAERIIMEKTPHLLDHTRVQVLVLVGIDVH